MASKKHQKNTEQKKLSCSDCGIPNCYREEKKYPDFCLTAAVDSSDLDGITSQYRGEGIDARIARASAEVEGKYYGKLTRVEETIAFANRIGAKKIGLATCIGLSRSQDFCKSSENKRTRTILCYLQNWSRR